MKMSRVQQDEQLARLRERYAGRGKEGKGRMLDELCEQHGYERKHAIKLLRGRVCLGVGLKGHGPARTYDAAVYEPLKNIWMAAEQIGSKRLAAALPLWVPFFEKHHGKLSRKLRGQLLSISAASIDRLLSPLRLEMGFKGRCGTKPGTLLRSQIPIRTGSWDIEGPGWLEADSVAHCGGSLAGDFIWSLTYTDICTQWTEGRAVWNKGAAGVVEQTRDVEASMPFAILGFDCDNGSEFLNHHLWSYFAQRRRPVGFTRSRPYHKDDNAHVEQKNWMHARQLLGYTRLEQPQKVSLINAMHKEAWGPLVNFFLPSAKLLSQERQGSQLRRKHDVPQTPYARLKGTGTLTRQARNHLKERYAALDPFALKAEVEKRLKEILSPASKPEAGE
jgi:hypothetical protein